MDYEKAYKESFEAAKGLHEAGNALTKMQMEIVFPQLAESEDKRIARAINNMLPFIPDEAYANNGVTKEDVLTWLEKQKENPKSCDSIPLDCASDAKYEGGWHKVGDSLPDNPREVICKDEAGNYFIGRYYVGEGWDISNYDDEDKSHHLNPPVSKWIDFPLEKQKEQKPNYCHHEVDETGWTEEYRKAYYDGWNNCNMQHEQLRADQKPAEWSEEDSEMMMRIINQVGGYTYFAGMDSERVVNWLKSLRPQGSKDSLQTHWKPTEEQMKTLLGAEGISRASGYPDNAKVLASLYEDLKKL